MSAQMQVILIAAGCTGAVGAAGIGVIRLLRRASLRLSLQAGSAMAVLAIVAGTLGTAKAMFLSQHDLRVVVMVCVVASVVAFGFCWLLGRQVGASSLALRQAARSLGQEEAGFRSPPGPMAAELAALSRELAETAEKLRQSRERERRMEWSRRQLVAWVSHDLRTPLAGLRAMAEALEDGIATDPGRYHRRIRADVTRLSDMVDDLFELSRIQSGTLRLSLDRIALGDLVSDVVAGMEALALAHGVRLTGDFAGELLIHADPRELSRALGNLLTNAIRHTPPGGSVRVSAAEDARGVLVAVADGCGGIPEADLGSVFDLGWRGAEARTPGADGGAGLGLAIVRGIVEAHQGRVNVVNNGDGCRFELRLPALAPSVDAVPMAAAPLVTGPVSDRAGLTIPSL
jgi:signal transduction histidine kinase